MQTVRDETANDNLDSRFRQRILLPKCSTIIVDFGEMWTTFHLQCCGWDVMLTTFHEMLAKIYEMLWVGVKMTLGEMLWVWE